MRTFKICCVFESGIDEPMTPAPKHENLAINIHRVAAFGVLFCVLHSIVEREARPNDASIVVIHM